MLVDLVCRQYNDPSLPFKVELLSHAIDHLLADVALGHRVYELMMIRRPGDLWKYLWVKPIEVSLRIHDAISRKRDEDKLREARPWPTDLIPLLVFDKCFCWAWDDTTPESECWLTERDSNRFNIYGRHLFDRVREAQEQVKQSPDILIQAELRAMEAWEHMEDTKAEVSFEQTKPDYESPTASKRSSSYYAKLRNLLMLPDVTSAASLIDNDYHVLHAMCTEQRRRVNAGDDYMPIHVSTDFLKFPGRWKARAKYWQEGIGFGTLLIGKSVLYLLEKGQGGPWGLSDEDEGEKQGFLRTMGDGWVVYQDIRENEKIAALGRWMNQHFNKPWA